MCTVVPDSGELEMETVEGSKMEVKIHFAGEVAQLFRADLETDSVCFRFRAYFT
ncbi:unnamed protein product [Gongylonema pulchrum]|uniref:Galectin n=1 Tax=Gongylonema pulchrum TaxID=637853 RepID=A0A183DHB5_9BILA|nr:unnamed protein product [Gongylonema pulchrum]